MLGGGRRVMVMCLCDGARKVGWLFLVVLSAAGVSVDYGKEVR